MVEAERCMGCMACRSVCPHDAIYLEKDELGFLFPVIDETKCVTCGLCHRVCPVTNAKENAADDIAVYAALNKDEKVRIKSSSGGIFILMADYILEKSGIVFGAAFSPDYMKVQHICVESKDELSKLQGSKYLQSEIGESLDLVRRYLEEGRYVLFSGTPCQIAGLKTFLQKDYSTLYTLDVICHGVPANLAWEKYVKAQKREDTDALKKAAFRDKSTGWKNYSVTLEFDKSIVSSQVGANDFMKGFLSDLYLRESCYNCVFKDENYYSDITLGDFWGVEKSFPELDDGQGTSVVVVHTKHGQEFFNEICNNTIYKAVSKEVALKSNPSYYRPVKSKIVRNNIAKELRKRDFHEVIDRHCGISLLSKCRRKLYKLIEK